MEKRRRDPALGGAAQERLDKSIMGMDVADSNRFKTKSRIS
jgi:hypothetical protein